MKQFVEFSSPIKFFIFISTVVIVGNIIGLTLSDYFTEDTEDYKDESITLSNDKVAYINEAAGLICITVDIYDEDGKLLSIHRNQEEESK